MQSKPVQAQGEPGSSLPAVKALKLFTERPLLNIEYSCLETALLLHLYVI